MSDAVLPLWIISLVQDDNPLNLRLNEITVTPFIDVGGGKKRIILFTDQQLAVAFADEIECGPYKTEEIRTYGHIITLLFEYRSKGVFEVGIGHADKETEIIDIDVFIEEVVDRS